MRERTDIGYWRGATVEACIIMQASSKWTGHLVAPRLSVYDVLPGGVAEQAGGGHTSDAGCAIASVPTKQNQLL